MTDRQRADTWRRIALEVRAHLSRVCESLGECAAFVEGWADGYHPTPAGRQRLLVAVHAAHAAAAALHVEIPPELAREIGEEASA